MYIVKQNDKDAKYPNYKVHPSWSNNRFETLKEAVDYANNWLGGYGPIPESYFDFDNQEDEVKEIKFNFEADECIRIIYSPDNIAIAKEILAKCNAGVNAVNKMSSEKQWEGWEILYNKIFSPSVSKRIFSLLPNFSYYDPDTSYQDDVEAFVNALNIEIGVDMNEIQEKNIEDILNDIFD